MTDTYTTTQLEPLEPLEPYKGLRPYEEENRDLFFGRGDERDIVIDKLLSNKLTLLFAASGVGKSSLLQAAVIPHLKQQDQENLDVVYYSDWFAEPIKYLKKETLKALKERGKLADDLDLNVDIPLDQFFGVCAAFASDPLVVVLDQFEEFFQYQRYQENFLSFIREFSMCIKDKATSVAFVISMREDYAMELNVFKEFLPTTLFANFFRLEKLEKKRAEEAVRLPVEELDFKYEEKLLKELVDDLADREKESQLGSSSTLSDTGAPAYVEPPYLQIVCTGLWELEKDNPDKTIRHSVYQENGRARGFVDSYFKNVMNKLTKRQQKIASHAFSHLVTPRGTKIAYTVEALNSHIRVGEEDLETVLEKLRESRIVRSKKRDEVVWYELYHDAFSGIIYQWHESFSKRERNKKIAFTGGTFTTLLLLMSIYLFFLLPKFYLHPQHGTGSDKIELYKQSGKLKIKSFIAETGYKQFQFEKEIEKKGEEISNFKELNREMISRFPGLQRISAYFKAGVIDKAFEALGTFINERREERYLKDRLKAMELVERFRELDKLLDKKEQINDMVRLSAAEYLVQKKTEIDNEKVEDTLIEFLNIEYLKDVDETPGEISPQSEKQKDIKQSGNDMIGEKQKNEQDKLDPDLEPIERIKLKARMAEALGSIKSKKAVSALGKVLKITNKEYKEELVQMRREAARALGLIGGEEAIKYLKSVLLDDPDWNDQVRRETVKALGRIGSENAASLLYKALDDENVNVQRDTVKALGNIHSKNAVEYLKRAIGKEDYVVRRLAAESLGKIRLEEAIPLLEKALKDDEYKVRNSAVIALGEIKHKKSADLLIKALSEVQHRYVSQHAIESLTQIDPERAVLPLYNKLKKDKEDSYVRTSAANALASIVNDGNDQALSFLKTALNDKDKNVRSYARRALKQLKNEKYLDLFIDLLKNNKDTEVRQYAVDALGRIGNDRAVGLLIDTLNDTDLKVRSKVIETFGKFKSEITTKRLLKVIEDKTIDSLKRTNAAFALGHTKSEKAVEPLIKLLEENKPTVVKDSVTMLGKLGSEKAVEPLIKLLEDNDKEKNVRYESARSLSLIGSKKAVIPLIKVLGDGDEDKKIQRSAYDALNRMDIKNQEAVKLLLGMIKKDRDKVERKRAIKLLGRTGSKDVVEPLIDILDESDSRIQEYAIEALGNIGIKNNKATDRLIRLLNPDGKSHVQKEAASALAKIGDENAIKSLILLLKKNQNRYTRSSIVKALSHFNSEKAVDRFIEALRDENDDKDNVRSELIKVLGNIGNEKAIPHLIRALQDQNRDVPYYSKLALSQISSEKTIGAIIEALKDGNRYVRREAASVLGDIGSEKAVTPLIQALKDSDTSTRKSAAHALGLIGSEKAVEPLIEALNDKSNLTREFAAWALGRIGSSKAIEPLIEALNAKNHFTVRYRAAQALGRIGSNKAVEPLMEALKEKKYYQVRDFAAQALERIGSKKATGTLIESLNSNSLVIRRYAIYTLGNISVTEYADNFKSILDNEQEKTVLRMTAAAALLKTGEKKALQYLKRQLETAPYDSLIEMTKIIGEVPSKEGITLLEEMLNLTGHRSKEQSNLQMKARLMAVTALGNIPGENAFNTLLKLLDHKDERIQFRALLVVGKLKSPTEKQTDIIKERISTFKEKLDELTEKKETWRDIRDENTSQYSPSELKEWEDRLDEIRPQEHLEFQLAYVISRFDKNEGTKLLCHELANVRQGAWMALGNRKNISLTPKLSKLIEEENDRPWVQFAAYRAVDNILNDAEYFGGKEELDELDRLFPTDTETNKNNEDAKSKVESDSNKEGNNKADVKDKKDEEGKKETGVKGNKNEESQNDKESKTGTPDVKSRIEWAIEKLRTKNALTGKTGT
jgi:HEAT repeat protein